MAAAPARALAADKRWGFAAAAAAPGRTPAAGVVETAPKPTDLPTQRGALPWGDRPMRLVPNAWGSSSLLSLKKGEGSGSFVNINDHPSSPVSSSMSTDESDLLDSPVSCGRTSHDSVTAISRPQSTELRSGSWKFAHSQISFLDVLKAPLRTIAKKEVILFLLQISLGNQNRLNYMLHKFLIYVCLLHVLITGIILLTGMEFVFEEWYHMVRAGKPADKTVSFPVEPFTHDGQSVLNQGGEERHGPHGVYHPENNDSCYAHVPVDTFVKSLPHLILEKVKDNHSDALEKQPVIKKDVALLEKIKCLPHHILGKVKGNHSDALEKQPVIKENVALLEKIKCLNIKARNLRACNMPEISLCKESKVECPKSLNLKADHLANDVPFSAATSFITSAFDMANYVSERISTANNHEDQPLAENCSQQGHARTANDLLKSPHEIQHSRRELSAQNSQPQGEERGKSQQKAKSIAKLEFVQNQKSNDAPGKSGDSHVYGGWNALMNKLGCAEDIPFNISRHGWEGHPAVDSLPVMTDSHQDQSFPWNTSQQGHVLTDDILNSPRYEIEMENENIEHEATFIAKPEDLSTQPFVHSLKSNDAPGESADYHVYARSNALRNRHGSSAEDISFSMPGHGWKDHSTVDSLPVVRTDTYQDQSFPEGTSLQVQGRAVDDMVNSPGYDIELSRRELSAQHPKQLQEEERGKLQQKAKANAKLEELKRCLFVQNHMSNDVPQETNKNLCKQNAGSAAKNTAAAISSTQNVMCAAKKTDISMLEHIAQKTEAESHDSNAPKLLQTEDREGQVHKQESISRGSTPASDTAAANISPLIPNTISPVKNTEIKIMEPIDLKGVSHTNESRTPMHLQMEEKRRQVHSHRRILRGCTPASGPAGVNKGSLIHNVIPSAKNNENSMMEHIAWKSASQSHENSSPKRLQMENRQRQVHPQERVLRERSNIAESTEDITTVSGTHVNAPNAEAKPHVDLSTQSKNRPVSPCVFGTKNTETSGLLKAPVSGVVINSSIITMQTPLARGFTVGSIMLGDVSVASNQEKTVAKEVDDDTTNSCASPKQTKQLGKNQHDEQHAKDPHGCDSIMCAEVKEPSKKERPEAGGVNCMAIPAPNHPSGNQSTVLQDAVPAKTSEIESMPINLNT
ncbi:unnamed protein product [Miscanthus lutarioriparius]|uniref:Uncharacterized protein n=1 Tax=Miscanthus lutarioriparius TaxID=422564 RepID=A0A811Q9C4_9POAL|nr:unnamed protein product [Miscanthus lutarioriparius]